MIKDLVDAVIALIFCGSMSFGSVEVYKLFKTEAKKVLEKGSEDTLPFSRELSKKKFDWEVE